MTVAAKRSQRVIQSFLDVVLSGSKDAVLNFLEQEPLLSQPKKFSFSQLLFLLEDKEFFLKVIAILRKRKIFNVGVWKYAFYH